MWVEGTCHSGMAEAGAALSRVPIHHGGPHLPWGSPWPSVAPRCSAHPVRLAGG